VVVGSGGRPAKGLRLAGAGGGGTIGLVPTQIGESRG
jgi:hypothetical protein